MQLEEMIDLTCLNPAAEEKEIDQLCFEGISHRFHAVVVHPCRVSLAVDRLKGSKVKVCSVVGFPSGCHLRGTKVDEAGRLVDLGADELDMVINIGWAKEKKWDEVGSEIHQVVKAAQNKCVKVILETSLLNDEEIVRACQAAEEAGAHFVKTSTGFNGGAVPETVRLMRETVSERIGVKASGGIRDRKTALEMIGAGATRIGTSSGAEIIKKTT